MDTYICVNRQGKDCGVKTLTDSMADRLERGGWTLIPAGSVSQASAQAVKR